MLDELVTDACALIRTSGPPAILGLAGPPAAGKSTLARQIVAAANGRLGADRAAYLPMDGFHLSNAQLDRLGRRDHKGAPDTFDVAGYLALLRRLAVETAHPVYVPDFDRALHEPVAARHVVHPGTRLIVTEGNYLAWDAPGWREVPGLLSALWYVDADDALREERLLRRQMAGGLDAAAARAWVARSDHPNGELVKATRARCDRVVRPPDRVTTPSRDRR